MQPDDIQEHSVNLQHKKSDNIMNIMITLWPQLCHKQTDTFIRSQTGTCMVGPSPPMVPPPTKYLSEIAVLPKPRTQ